ncbi:MAG: tRNA (adenosine(37)-N6)-threonylcarbamoyltransferase complex dimerization subunit type 1 TsaB [Chitinispirillales bacterium]|jgi:tRNA threonylcarbamoyladenosine biosynthesis protein TsaB|nr:tRNA (adenosine(37)-N6)-threonylcarbamoyltransferase complex dimerization subunit type 1 TsaB [Chitinispirillales bacterium]
MIILGIDTSSTDLSVCLSADGFPLSIINRYVKNSHAEHITQAVTMAISFGGLRACDVTHVAVSVGPGSFTGLRIGLSFIKGFCMMAERKAIPISSLMVLAHAACGHLPNKRGRIFTALDARQGRVHWGGFICNDGVNTGISRLTNDRLSLPEELLGELLPDDILVTDTMGYSRSTVFQMFEGKTGIIRAEKSSLSRALSCASIAFDNIGNEPLWLSASQIVPNYLQASAAEEKRAMCS